MEDGEPHSPTNVRNSMLRFTLAQLNPATTGPRLGQLLRAGQKAIETPHYVATTSRGVVPHISHDILRKHTEVSSIYLGLEDCTYRNFAPTSCADSLLTVSSQS
jgi:hypothetical protein